MTLVFLGFRRPRVEGAPSWFRRTRRVTGNPQHRPQRQLDEERARATGRYNALHELTITQLNAIDLLAGGKTDKESPAVLRSTA